MKNFENFLLEKEKEEILNLMCELKIDSKLYLNNILNEGIFSDMGKWWKQNITASNVVRLSQYRDEAQEAIDNFVKNFVALSKQGVIPTTRTQSGLYKALSNIRQNLRSIKSQIDQMDQDAKHNLQKVSYADIKNWDNSQGFRSVTGDIKDAWNKTAPWRQTAAQGANKAWQNVKQGWSAQRQNP